MVDLTEYVLTVEIDQQDSRLVYLSQASVIGNFLCE